MTRPLVSVGRRLRFRHVLNVVSELDPPRSILDAGCGDGRMSLELARRYGGSAVLGIDPDPGRVASARAAAGGRPNVRFEVGAVGGPDLGERFDRIVCIDVLEHIRDDEAGLAWIARHLAPEGRLILHVPASGQKHVSRTVARAVAAEVEAGVGPHFREGYDPERLKAAAANAGLRPERVAWTFHSPVARWAVDVEHWTFLRGAKPLKAVLLPALLIGAAVERQPAEDPGNGLLFVAAAG